MILRIGDSRVKELTATLLAIVLGLIALLHASWALGGLWPGKSEADLIAKAIGDGRRHMPGRAITWFVACLIGIAAIWPLLLSARPARLLPSWLVTTAGLAMAVIFLARGAAGYVPAWRRLHSAEPFARLDRSYYSPLCLVIGAGFAYLILS
jgi:hypothetical protein